MWYCYGQTQTKPANFDLSTLAPYRYRLIRLNSPSVQRRLAETRQDKQILSTNPNTGTDRIPYFLTGIQFGISMYLARSSKSRLVASWKT